LTGITATSTTAVTPTTTPSANPFNTGIAVNPNFNPTGVSQILVNPTSGSVLVGTTTIDTNGVQSVHFPPFTLGSQTTIPTQTGIVVAPITGTTTVSGITQLPNGTFTNVQQ